MWPAVRPPWQRAALDAVLASLRDQGPVHEDAVQVGVFLLAERTFAEARPVARSLNLWLILPRLPSDSADLPERAPGPRAVRRAGEAGRPPALVLLHHARRAARTAPDGSPVPLAEQDRGRWESGSIAEGVRILQAALARDRLGEFQAQAALAALEADPPTAEETDWVQIVERLDELVRLTDSPVVRLNRALAELDESLPLAEREHLTRQVARLNARRER